MSASSLNSRMLDRVMRHQIALLRLEAGARGRALQMMYKLEKDIQGNLFRMDPTKPVQAAYRRKRLAKLFKQVTALSADSYKDIVKEQGGELFELAEWENSWARNMVDDVIGVELGGITFTKTFLNSMVSDTLIEGAPSKDWWKQQDAKTVRRFKNEVRMGMLSGETIQEISDRVRKRVMPISRREADALTRTSYHAIAQKARYETFKDMDDVMSSFQWLATLDTKTSDICKARSGKLYDMELNPIGHEIPSLGGPPAHWNCRSTLLPVTKSWEELGAKTKSKLKDTGPSTQASMNGQVPADLNYEGWLKTQPTKVQKEVLGKGRWQLWKDGKIKNFSQLVDQTGRSLTLAELKGIGQAAVISSISFDALQDMKKALVKTSEGNFSFKTEEDLAEYHSLVAQLSDEDYEKERWEVLKGSIFSVEELTNVQKKNLLRGVSYIPHDQLVDLRMNKVTVWISKTPKVQFRPFYDHMQGDIGLPMNFDHLDAAHEFAHAIDNAWSGAREFGVSPFNKARFGVWREASNKEIFKRFRGVTKEEGVQYKSWWQDQIKAQSIGTYTNGDGDFWQDNWLNSYEGRIYEGRHPAKSFGEEWFAMNAQRYAEYADARDARFGKKLLAHKRNLEKASTKAYAESVQSTIDKMEKEGPEKWALKNSKWKMVRKRYPELAGFMEEKFGQRFIDPELRRGL